MAIDELEKTDSNAYPGIAARKGSEIGRTTGWDCRGVAEQWLIVTSRSVSLTDRSLFLAHGQDPRGFDAVVVKSPHCRRDYFDDWAGQVMTVDTPGSTSANLQTLGHTACPRPMFPLDPQVGFDPQVKICRSSVGG